MGGTLPTGNGSNTCVAEPGADMKTLSPFPSLTELRTESSPRTSRIALYSHDTMGLGHTRRNMLIARSLAGAPLRANILLIAGTHLTGNFVLPPGVDCLTLPALAKQSDAQYHSRYLDLSLSELVALRAKTICAALEAFDPDILVVDNVPRGAIQELDLTLQSLRARGHTRCVLGLRDVLDEPVTVEREWERLANEDTIRAYFDAIWVYGDRAVYNLAHEYHFATDVAAKMNYVGYLDQRMRLQSADACQSDPFASLALPPGQLVLCLVGGGEDGASLAQAFARATLPPETNGVIVTGPFMPRTAQQDLRSLAATNPRLRVLEFVNEPARLLARADAVIAMGGYNTTCEILSFERRALIVPRVRPRREQLIRAARLSDLGLLEMLHPDELSPCALTRWLFRDKGSLPPVRERVNLEGLAHLPHLVEEVTVTPARPVWDRHSRRAFCCVE